jgi:polyisoprenoid-binding protein YceI
MAALGTVFESISFYKHRFIHMARLALLILILISWIPGTAQTSNVVSGKTSFSIKYWAGTCAGSFDAPKGRMKFDAARPEATEIDVTIATGSFKTGNNMRDKDVKDKKYLDAAAHPQISFRSNKVTNKGGTYYAEGTLTIKGAAQKVFLPFKATKNSDGSYAISSNFTLNRLDFKVGESTSTMKNIITLNISAVIK